MTGSTDKLASYLLKLGAANTSGGLSTVLNYLGSGADYVCYVNGKQTTYKDQHQVPGAGGQSLLWASALPARSSPCGS